MFDESFSRYWNRSADADKKVTFTKEQIEAMPPRLRAIYESIKDNEEALRLFEKYTVADADDMEMFIDAWEQMHREREKFQVERNADEKQPGN